jgi:hypothetical protein
VTKATPTVKRATILNEVGSSEVPTLRPRMDRAERR